MVTRLSHFSVPTIITTRSAIVTVLIFSILFVPRKFMLVSNKQDEVLTNTRFTSHYEYDEPTAYLLA